MSMRTVCCDVVPVWVSYNRELWKETPGPDHWTCPECGKIHPPCNIIRETAGETFARKCKEYGSNTPIEVAEVTEEDKESIRFVWNAALEAVLSKSETYVFSVDARAVLRLMIDRLKK